MLKKSINLISIILAAILLITAAPISCADNAVPELPYFDLPCSLHTVKVGLYHGSSAVNAAEFSLESGSAYKLGFYDFSRSFHKLGELECADITARGDVGFTVGEGKNEESVGAWHIMLKEALGGFDEAKAAANKYGGFVGYVDYKYVVLVGSFDSADEANSAISNTGLSGSPFTGSANSVLISKAGSTQALFLYDSAGRKLCIGPSDENTGTCLGGRTYKGDFSLSRKGNALCVTNYVGLEDYVKGVLPYEVSSDWPAEALKAQAVCARTYAVNCINEYADRDFDVRDDTYSQVYKGITYSDSVINAAADDTCGELVRYEGAICKVYYMSSDGGGTEDGINVFGERRKYLSAVADSFEAASGFYGKTWTEKLTPAQLSYDLCDHGFDIGDVVKIDSTYSEMGNIIRLDFTDADSKTACLERRECYSVLGLNSIRYDVTEEETDNGDKIFVFTGCGWGHNCGMSQWGACTMANNSNITCEDIISFYFSGAYIR